MADTSKKGKGGNQKGDGKDKQAQNQNKVSSVKESKEEVTTPSQPQSSTDVDQPAVINPNTNQPNPQLPPRDPNKPARKDRVYHQGTGSVRQVISGDIVVIYEPPTVKNAPPSQREIQLTNIQAPRLGHRTTHTDKTTNTQVVEYTRDEPFAFQSREFLRKLAIGQPVSFTVFDVTDRGSREYGYVYVNRDGREVSLADVVVSEGFATVRQGKEGALLRPEVEELIKLQESAKKDNKGVFNKAGEASAVRSTSLADREIKAAEFYEKNKGAPLQGIIERVLNGGLLILTLFPSMKEARLILSGVECPGEKNKGQWEPFGREAKFCTEYFLLNREVQVILEGADKNNLYGTLDFRGNNISEELLKRGLARYVDWSGNRTAFVERLKSAEKSAKERKLCIWNSYVEQKALSRQEEKKLLRPGKEMIGHVTQIISASTLTFVDQQNNEHLVQLSSIVAPRGGSMKPEDEKTKEDKSKEEKSKDEKTTGPEEGVDKSKKQKDREAEALERTYAWEAKEWLRKRLIGQRVRVVLDYIQPADQSRAHQGREDKDRNCFSVYIDRNNIAVELCAQGLVNPRNHRGGEPRSRDYEDMLKAETLAKNQSRGMFQKADKAATLYINDISANYDNANRFLPIMKRMRQRGVVVYVFHAAKFKIYVPSQSCELILTLSALQVPRNDKNKTKEAHYDESIAFVQKLIYQRDVEFDVFQVTKVTQPKGPAGGNFIGALFANKENLSVSLLQQGYAKLLRGIAQNLDNYQQLEGAEDSAKRQKKNLWENYDEAAEQEAREKRRAERSGASLVSGGEEYIDVNVTEILDASSFFVQIVGDVNSVNSDSQKLDELMKNLSLEDTAADSNFTPAVGTEVKAQYSFDDHWYRASVLSVDGDNYRVLYIDYGNSETIPSARIRALSQQFTTQGSKLKAQAVQAGLAYVKCPTLSEDYGQEAAEMLRDLVENKTLSAQVEYRDGQVMCLSLLDNNKIHINGALVKAGLARVKKPRGVAFTQKREIIDKLLDDLRAEERQAKSSHACVWEYGDPGSDEDEERPAKGTKKPEVKKTAEVKKTGAK